MQYFVEKLRINNENLRICVLAYLSNLQICTFGMSPRICGFMIRTLLKQFAGPPLIFVDLKGQCQEMVLVSPQPQSIPLRPFRIFSKIRGDIRSSRFATVVNDTGGVPLTLLALLNLLKGKSRP